MERSLIKVAFLGLSLCVLTGLGLPVNKNAPQTKEKHQVNNIPGLDLQEYMRYWEETAKNDPGESVWSNNLLPSQLADQQRSIRVS